MEIARYSLLCITFFLSIATTHQSYSPGDVFCIDVSDPEVLIELMDTTLFIGGNGELLELAVSKTTKDMARAGGKFANDVIL